MNPLKPDERWLRARDELAFVGNLPRHFAGGLVPAHLSMHSPDSKASNDDTARLLGEAMRALKHQQEAAAASVHLAQAMLRAFQQMSRLGRELVERLPDEEAQEHYAEEMSRITRALAGVVEEFSPGIAPEEPAEEAAAPMPPGPLPEEFFVWMHAMKSGSAPNASDAAAAGRTLFEQAPAADRLVLVSAWRKAVRARASRLFGLSSASYQTE